MTLKELSQLYYLKREIELDQARLKKLRTKLHGASGPKYDAMPKSPGCGDALAYSVAEIVDLEALIVAKQIQCIRERTRLEQYIAGIPDSNLRTIFTLRFIDGLSWVQLAFRIGGDCTADGARMACKRYMEKSDEQKI